MKTVSLKEAKEGLEFLGMCMEAKYHLDNLGSSIQRWEMPRKEKDFFTAYTMNIALESEGFECLASQKPDDVRTFVRLLERLDAKKTAAFVRETLSTLKSKTPSEEDECTSKYYVLFRRDRVWLKLLDYVGDRIYTRYILRAQEINAAGGNIFNPKEWKGRLAIA